MNNDYDLLCEPPPIGNKSSYLIDKNESTKVGFNALGGTKNFYQYLLEQIPEVSVNISRNILKNTKQFSENKEISIVPKRAISLKSILADAILVEQEGRIDSALDLLYNAIDDLMWKENLDEIDSVLTKENAEQLSVDLGLALLCTTLPVRRHLSKRDSFYQFYEQRLEDRNENEPGLLDGLK